MKKTIKILCLLAIICYALPFNGFCVTPQEAALQTKIDLKPTGQGGYLLYVDEKPFLIKGVSYSPTPIGRGYDYNLFTDPSKPWLVDGELMKKAGINCVRVYSPGENLEKAKEFISDMYEKFGIYTLMSDWLGLWDYPRANYADSVFKAKTKEKLLKATQALKDEKGLLMWILGNENNYTFSGKIGFWTSKGIEETTEPSKKQILKAEIYYTFVNDLAKSMKEIDSIHPIALGNGEDGFLNVASNICTDLDALAIIIYRGKSFGNLFNNIRNSFDKPILLSEFGCDSYNAYKKYDDHEIQSEFLLAQWKDLYNSTAFSGNENGNTLGGVIFEWSDEWWKHNESYEEDWGTQNKEANWSHGAYFYDIRAKGNLNMNEEWFGIVALDKEVQNGVNLRQPKKSYYDLADYLPNLKFKAPAIE